MFYQTYTARKPLNHPRQSDAVAPSAAAARCCSERIPFVRCRGWRER